MTADREPVPTGLPPTAKAEGSARAATASRRARQLASAAAFSATSLTACLDAIGDCLRAYPKVDGYLINLYEPAENVLKCARMHLPAEYSKVEDAYAHYGFAVDSRDAHALAFARNEVVCVGPRNLAEFSPSTRARFERWHMRQLVAFPIRLGGPEGRRIGVLVIFSQRATFAASTLDGIVHLLDGLAPALHLHHRVTTLEAHAYNMRDTESEFRSLLYFIAEMNSLGTDRDIYPRLQREFLTRFDLDFAAVLIAEDGELRCADTLCRPDDASWVPLWQAHCRQLRYSLNLCDGAAGDCFINNRPLLFGDIPSIRHLPMGAKDKVNLELLPDLQTFVIFPIRKHGKPIGVLWLGSMRRKHALATSQLVTVQHLCDFLGSVIDNARTYTLLTALQNRVKILDNLASRDRLTGLFNFGSFEIELAKRLQAHRNHPKPSPMSLIMCDIDHFKRFNDTYGHRAGNEVLHEAATRITQTVRDNDFVARYGGEEFAIIFSRCDLSTAAQRAERIRERIARLPFYVDGAEHHVTLSLGCAELSPHDDEGSLLARADSALYAAKQDGRNRVMRAHSFHQQN